MGITVGGTVNFAAPRGLLDAELGDLANVEIANPVSGNFLAYDSATADWINRSIAEIDLPLSGVAAATYGSASAIPVITVNTHGIITAATSVAIPSASTTVVGVVELATNAETIAGTDATRAVTPSSLSLTLTSLQPKDATLTALAAMNTSADTYILATGSDTFTAASISGYGQTFVNSVDAAAARTALGLGTAATASAVSFQAANPTLTGLSAMTSSANQLVFATAVDTFATSPISTFGRSLVAATTDANARTTLGLGTAATSDASAFQAADATLTGLAAVTVGVNTLIFGSGTDAFSTSTITPFGRTLVAAADATGGRSVLGLGTAATANSTAFQPADATLTALAGVTSAADTITYATAADVFTTTPLTTFGRSLIDDVDAGTARTTLGLGTAAPLNASSANIASAVVQRDASGNFVATTVTAALTGNATTASTLQTPRSINGVSFDGSANITVADATKLPLTGGTVSGVTNFTSAAASSSSTTGAVVITGGLGVGGAIFAAGNITAFSDIRLKTDIEVIPDALEKLCTLRGVTYQRIDTKERHTGLIAQEVQAVLPEAVTGGEYLGVAYGNMMGLLVEAVKELTAKVETQDKIIHDLLQRIQ
jgi:hypothetical protein